MSVNENKNKILVKIRLDERRFPEQKSKKIIPTWKFSISEALCQNLSCLKNYLSRKVEMASETVLKFFNLKATGLFENLTKQNVYS